MYFDITDTSGNGIRCRTIVIFSRDHVRRVLCFAIISN